MAQVHLNPQHKGGIGKSYMAFLLAQHFLSNQQAPTCIDTDPSNQTFKAFSAFDAEWINICDSQNRFDESLFDSLMEKLLTAGEEDVFVIDCGTATFIPLCSYMAESNALSMLQDCGLDVYFHSVLAGGSDFAETVKGLNNIFKAFPEAAVCIWLNEFKGQIGDGKAAERKHGFEDTVLYQNNKSRIKALIQIAELNNQTFGKDIKQMTEKHLTFAEAIASAEFSIMAKQRLKMAWRDINEQLAAVQF